MATEAALHPVERAVLESEPDRPSTAILRLDRPGDTADARAAARRTEPGRLRTMLDGDLDAIVLKALRKEPDERYGSADAYREDIERYLGSQPVQARQCGVLLTRQQRWAEAVPLYRKSVDLARRFLGPDHDRVLLIQQNLAGALANSGEAEEALLALQDRLATSHRMWPNGHWRIGSAHQGIGKLLLQMERHADAEAAFRIAVASFHATIGPANTWSLVAETWVVMAMTLRGDARGPELLDAMIVRLSGAPLDGDTRADIGRIADRLEVIGMTERAQRFRALLEASQS